MLEYAKKARRQRLSGNHHDSGSLSGYCLDNSYVLYNILVNDGYKPKIVCGASENYSSEVISRKGIENINYVEDLEGHVHFWVECKDKIIDVASDIKNKYGEIIVCDDLPQSYYRLKNSYEYGSDIISSMPPRCRYCGGKYNYCECENPK